MCNIKENIYESIPNVMHSNSLRDSNVSAKQKTTKEQGVGATPWFATL
jgi:hypothetical protein